MCDKNGGEYIPGGAGENVSRAGLAQNAAEG